jgi:MerR family transcriptional regulator, copper efflux regulator
MKAPAIDLADARRAGFYNIGEVSRRTDVSARMIRHYEELQLLKAARRTSAGYRVYDDNDVHTLRFIRRARDLGFSMDEIKQLLGLWHNRRRASGDVLRIAQKHVAALDEKIRELRGMRRTLEKLMGACHGNDLPDCPILDDLAASD